MRETAGIWSDRPDAPDNEAIRGAWEQGWVVPKPVLVDTDVLIDFLRGHEQGVFFVNLASDRIILLSIVVAELYAGVRGGEGDSEQRTLDRFLS